jgi:hypothetical protein
MIEVVEWLNIINIGLPYSKKKARDDKTPSWRAVGCNIHLFSGVAGGNGAISMGSTEKTQSSRRYMQALAFGSVWNCSTSFFLVSLSVGEAGIGKRSRSRVGYAMEL